MARGLPRLEADGLTLLAAAMLLGEDASHRTVLGGEAGIVELRTRVRLRGGEFRRVDDPHDREDSRTHEEEVR